MIIKIKVQLQACSGGSSQDIFENFLCLFDLLECWVIQCVNESLLHLYLGEDFEEEKILKLNIFYEEYSWIATAFWIKV